MCLEQGCLSSLAMDSSNEGTMTVDVRCTEPRLQPARGSEFSSHMSFYILVRKMMRACPENQSVGG